MPVVNKGSSFLLAFQQIYWLTQQYFSTAECNRAIHFIDRCVTWPSLMGTKLWSLIVDAKTAALSTQQSYNLTVILMTFEKPFDISAIISLHLDCLQQRKALELDFSCPILGNVAHLATSQQRAASLLSFGFKTGMKPGVHGCGRQLYCCTKKCIWAGKWNCSSSMFCSPMIVWALPSSCLVVENNFLIIIIVKLYTTVV